MFFGNMQGMGPGFHFSTSGGRIDLDDLISGLIGGQMGGRGPYRRHNGQRQANVESDEDA